MTELFVSQPPQLWATFGIIALAIYLFASEKLEMITTSMLVICLLIALFYFMPMTNEAGDRLVDPHDLLSGFSNPALLAVLALLVIGQAVIRTGSLNGINKAILGFAKISPAIAIFVILTLVAVMSSFINDTPTVVIFMPILLAVVARLNISASKVMIPLSYAAILGGIVTLMGSSTNLLVSGALVGLGLEPLGFFDFTLPGAIIAAIGLAYVIFVLPFLLPDRAPLADELTGGGRQFVAQIKATSGSPLIGKSIRDAKLFGEKEVTIRMIQRREQAFLAPFDTDVTIREDDIIIVVATRETLKELISEKGEDAFNSQSATLPHGEEEDEKEDRSALAEILITPGSRLLGQTIEQIGFMNNYQCIVMGIQRKARMITSRMTSIRLAAGDVLLIMGSRQDIKKLRDNKDMVLMEWATEDLPSRKHALRVNLIFATIIGTAAFGLIPIYIAALFGAVAVILFKCLNLRQALRSIEVPIIFLVAAGLAMSVALEKTGGAAFLADSIINATRGAEPVWVMSAMFILIALLTNVLSNNATALLFTPIAVNTANLLNAPLEMFVFAVIFASNCCSLASPIGYQTNLLVMGPGHYKFSDYLRAGLPLVVIVWLTYTTFSYFYF
jgi:di/tricarboxylate transporter